MKKKIITTIALSLVVCFASAQKVKEAEVPTAVKEAFTQKYPKAKVEKWEKEDGNYEAEFDWNKDEASAIFDPAGTFKEYEVEIKTKALPAGVAEYCAKTFAGWSIAEATRITDADGKVSYKCEIKKGREDFDALFDEKGNFLKKSVEAKDEDDDDDKK